MPTVSGTWWSDREHADSDPIAVDYHNSPLGEMIFDARKDLQQLRGLVRRMPRSAMDQQHRERPLASQRKQTSEVRVAEIIGRFSRTEYSKTSPSGVPASPAPTTLSASIPGALSCSATRGDSASSTRNFIRPG